MGAGHMVTARRQRCRKHRGNPGTRRQVSTRVEVADYPKGENVTLIIQRHFSFSALIATMIVGQK